MLILSRYAVVNFSLKGEDVMEIIEGVDVFKYLGWKLNWSEDD